MQTPDPITRLVLIEQIKSMRARMARLLDLKEWEAWGECWALDSTLEAPEADLVLRGRDRIVAGVSAGMGPVRSVHQLHAPEIEITGTDTARGIWAMADSLERQVEGRAVIVNGYGHYYDTYVLEDGAWRVKSITLIRLRIDA